MEQIIYTQKREFKPHTKVFHSKSNIYIEPTPKKEGNFSKQKNFKNNFNNYKRNNKEPKVKISFLGGIGEIGKNMTVFETDKDIIILDCGMTFADKETPGIDIIVPDITYLKDKKDKVRAFIITHGHEDHIGSLPFVLSEIKAPIYASRFTLALIDNKMREYSKVKYKSFEVDTNSVLKLGDFSLEFVNVNHSIAGAMGIAITTPAGIIFHTGDFKIDNTPINSKTTDLRKMEEIGKRGVKLLMCESTNVGRDGWSLSETKVMEELEKNVFQKFSNNRLIIATFASNIFRMQEILSLAEKYKRKVAFTGRSMVNISDVAMKLGFLHYDKNNVISIDDIKNYADNEVTILTTGSQGEELSALTRMANDNFAKFKLTTNDVVVFSSSPIPGNEKSVYGIMNKLTHKGVGLMYDKLAEIHASGHACRDEIKLVINTIKPEFVLPVHGEYLHLNQFKELASGIGFADRNIIISDLGMQVIMTQNAVRPNGFIKFGSRLVDGNTFGDILSPVIKDRKNLAEDGFIIAILNISSKSAKLVTEPLIITRGFLYNHEIENVLKDLKTAISVHIKNYDLKNVDANELKNSLRKFISNQVSRKTKRKPMVLCTTIIN